MRRPLKAPLNSLLLMLLCAVCVQAQEADFSPQQAMYRPAPIPDRVVLTWIGDPAGSQAVTWRTDTSVKQGVAEIAVAGEGPGFAGVRSVPAATSELKSEHWTANYHSVVFRNLTPDTLYAYRVGDGTLWSEWFHFRTASAKPEPFAFLHFGDVQNDIRSIASRVIREAFKHAPDARFVTFAGDLVNDGRNDVLWGEFFGAGGWLYGMIPIVPAAGNHEYRNKVLTDHWRAQFTLPLNGIKGMEESSYFIDYQGLRMIALNSNRMQDEQAGWLEAVLEHNPNRWTIVVFHHPFYTLRPERKDNSYLIKNWKPLFDEYGVDLVLTGHDHAYGRSAVDGSAVYCASVTGGKMRPLERQPWMVQATENTQLF